VDLILGRPPSIHPAESAVRIITSRGGYCYHLNGAFGSLLTSLGFDVTPIRGAVPDATDESRLGNHLVLLVTIDDATWVADVGFGDGFRDPIALVPGLAHQPPFDYELVHQGGARWRFRHDLRSTIAGFDFDLTPVALPAFTTKHEHLSTSPDSPFVRVFVMQSHRHDHTVVVRGCVLTRTDDTGSVSRDVTDPHEWFDLLAAEFDVKFDDADVRDALWRRVSSSHQAWIEAGRP
jgi:N-hydroxyarylamine O-acetyltransferase